MNFGGVATASMSGSRSQEQRPSSERRKGSRELTETARVVHVPPTHERNPGGIL